VVSLGLLLWFFYHCDQCNVLRFRSPFHIPSEACIGDGQTLHPGTVYTCRKTFQQSAEASVSALNIELAVFDPFKISYCYIPKNSCTKIKRLFMRLIDPLKENWNDSSVHMDFFKSDKVYVNALNDQLKLELQSESQWIRSIILRDPIDRFLSAYLEKTVQHGWIGVPVESLDAHPKFTPDAAGIHEFFKYKDFWEKDVHWRLQKTFCGLNSGLQHNFYNKFVVMAPNLDMNSIMTAMFGNRIDHSILHGWEGMNDSLFMTETDHSTFSSPSRLSLVTSLCANQTMLDMIVEYTAPDYEFFTFHLPTLCH